VTLALFLCGLEVLDCCCGCTQLQQFSSIEASNCLLLQFERIVGKRAVDITVYCVRPVVNLGHGLLFFPIGFVHVMLKATTENDARTDGRAWEDGLKC